MMKRGSNLSINLSAIAYCEDSVWIAHCLELDIVAEGKDANDAIRSLVLLCDLQIKVALEEGDLESIFRSAPPEVWKMFATGKGMVVADKKQTHKKESFQTPVNRFEARELTFT